MKSTMHVTHPCNVSNRLKRVAFDSQRQQFSTSCFGGGGGGWGWGGGGGGRGRQCPLSYIGNVLPSPPVPTLLLERN